MASQPPESGFDQVAAMRSGRSKAVDLDGVGDIEPGPAVDRPESGTRADGPIGQLGPLDDGGIVARGAIDAGPGVEDLSR